MAKEPGRGRWLRPDKLNIGQLRPAHPTTDSLAQTVPFPFEPRGARERNAKRQRHEPALPRAVSPDRPLQGYMGMLSTEVVHKIRIEEREVRSMRGWSGDTPPLTLRLPPVPALRPAEEDDRDLPKPLHLLLGRVRGKGRDVAAQLLLR